MNVQEASKVFTYLQAAYPGRTFLDESLLVWADVFSDVPCERIMAAVKQAVRECVHPPGPAEITAILDADSGTTTQDGLDELNKEIQYTGYMGRPVLSPLVAYTVNALGGWRSVCAMDRRDLDKRFAQTYPAIKQQRARQDRLRAPLVDQSRSGELPEGGNMTSQRRPESIDGPGRDDD